MSSPYKQIESALDRLQESHWFLHQIETHYHNADALRFSLNAFIRSIKEVPQMVTSSLQNNSEFVEWHKPVKMKLIQDNNIISKLIGKRNHIVHKSMLKPKSKAFMATVRGKTIKMQFDFYIDPFEDSDIAFKRFLKLSNENPVLFNILAPDDTQILTLIREWRITGLDDEIMDVSRKAWLVMVKYLSEVLGFLDAKGFPRTLPDCFVNTKNFMHKRYSEKYVNVLKKCSL